MDSDPNATDDRAPSPRRWPERPLLVATLAWLVVVARASSVIGMNLIEFAVIALGAMLLVSSWCARALIALARLSGRFSQLRLRPYSWRVWALEPASLILALWLLSAQPLFDLRFRLSREPLEAYSKALLSAPAAPPGRSSPSRRVGYVDIESSRLLGQGAVQHFSGMSYLTYQGLLYCPGELPPPTEWSSIEQVDRHWYRWSLSY